MNKHGVGEEVNNVSMISLTEEQKQIHESLDREINLWLLYPENEIKYYPFGVRTDTHEKLKDKKGRINIVFSDKHKQL